MFSTVLFLARDNAAHGDEAVPMFRGGFPVAEGSPEWQRDQLLTRVLAERPPRTVR